MEHETISALRVDLYECDTRPAETLKPHVPVSATRHAWIPQTMGDQIWVLYEFNTKEERETWENSLPEQISNWLDRKLISNALSYGWHSRDVNGFCS